MGIIQFNSIYFVFDRSKGVVNPQDIELSNEKVGRHLLNEAHEYIQLLESCVLVSQTAGV